MRTAASAKVPTFPASSYSPGSVSFGDVTLPSLSVITTQTKAYSVVLRAR